MTADTAFANLVGAFLTLHARSPALQSFCPCPEAPVRREIAPFHIPAASLMQQDKALVTTRDLSPLRDACIAAIPYAKWRETYKDAAISAYFLERFGCYCLIGEGGPYTAPGTSAYVVYMPPLLWYPRHHHPAEEIYFVLAGEAEFHLDGHAPRLLRPGDHVLHPSNAPHATRTHDKPLMALVLWRGDLGTRPVLTPEDTTP